nr:DUF4350 domain-containing protein [Haloplanus sp. XH21]
MRLSVLGRTLSIGAPQAVLAGLSLAFVVALVTAGVTATAPFAAYNADWTGTADLRALADEGDRSVFVVSNAMLPAETRPNETVLLLLGVGELTPETRGDVEQFVERGGTLVVTADADTNSTPLLETVGATARIQDGPLRDPREYYRSPALPIAEPTENAELPNGSGIILNHAGVVDPGGATVLARTSEFAYIDTNRNGEFDSTESLGSRPVLTTERVADGRVVVLSDSSVFVNAMLDRPGNEALATALLADHERVVLSSDGAAPVPPVANALLVLRRSPGLQMVTLVGLLGTVVASRRYLERGEAFGERDPTGDIGQPGESGDDSTPSERVEGFVAVLRQDHPEWDRGRLERVVRAAIDREDSNDE